MSRAHASLSRGPYEPDAARKGSELLAGLNELTALHRERCVEFDRICAHLHPRGHLAQDLAEVPYVPVGLFKSMDLRSVPEEQIHRVMRSSGTTGVTSKIYLDEATADTQANVLSEIMTFWLGTKRRPMLIVDTKSILRGAGRDSARAAAVVGMMRFGGAHHFALDDAGDLDVDALTAWLDKHAEQQIFVFGFTFLVWSKLLAAAREVDLDLSRATLFHGGGWKRLEDEAVSARDFNNTLQEACGLHDIRNYYGMIEQVGSIYVESGDGVLVPPRYADVLVRDPMTLEPLPPGDEGVLQVLSVLPRSYPGHSILTEDIGVVVENPHEPERLGPWGLKVNGRLPRAETRGCSDVYAA